MHSDSKKTKDFVVMQVLPALKSGGVERGTLEIAHYLSSLGIRNFVCSSGGPLVAELDESMTRHLKLPVESKNPFLILLNAWRIAMLVRKYGITILHARSRAPAWSCWIASWFINVEFITTFHGAYSVGNALKRLYNSVMLRGPKVIAVSQYIAKHLETEYHVVPAHVEVINRGVDVHKFDRNAVTKERLEEMKKLLGVELDPKTKVILMPARYSRLKGHTYLLKALKYLRTKKFKCIMVGKKNSGFDSYTTEIQDLVKELSLEGKVHTYFDCVTDMPALYALSDVVVACKSEPEAFGRTIVEAQAMEKIVVSTKLGGPAHTIIDGETGFFIPTSDTATFAEVLDHALGMTKDEATAFGKKARKWAVENYSMEHMCTKTVNLYKSLVSFSGDYT